MNRSFSLLFTGLILCLILSPIISAQKTKPASPTTQRRITNETANQIVQACCSLGSWNLATHLGPGQRGGAAMAYDSSRHRVVLYGGWVGGVRMGDTWEWDGTTWTQRTTAGPGPRVDHAMAYDPLRSRVVLFGGTSGGGFLGDTWEWDGIAWALKSNVASLARAKHAMAFDSVRGKVIMYGGETWKVDGGFFEWNGTSWTGIPTPIFGANPGARELHTMASDSARGRVVLFGGVTGAGVTLGDTWEWDGSSWTKKIVTGPSARVGASMAFCDACGKVTLFGGGNTTYFSDTWQWDGVTWTQVAAGGPTPRSWSGMAYDSLNQKIVVFGGGTAGGQSDETWTMDTTALSADFQLSATSPSGNPATYQVTATNAPLGNGVSFWWKVEEIDVSTGAVVPNTTVVNPSAWWPNPTTNVFSGYYNNNSPIGVFYQGHKYRISHGVWNSCNPWMAVSKSVFMCSNCRTPEMKVVPSIKVKPKMSMQ